LNIEAWFFEVPIQMLSNDTRLEVRYPKLNFSEFFEKYLNSR